jgi:hypothetical protein
VTGLRVYVDGWEVARHNGPLVDHRRRVTPGTSWWWLHTTMRTVLPRRFEVEFIEATPGG